MRATLLLQTQHQHIQSIFDAIERPGASREKLVRRLATALLGHMVIEEEIFYPNAKKAQLEQVMMGFEEHESELPALQRLLATRHDDAAFMARLNVLKELIQGHVGKEESILFPAADRLIDEATHETLGRMMEHRFQEVTRSGAQHALQVRQAESAARAPKGQAEPESERRPEQKEKGEHREKAGQKAGTKGEHKAGQKGEKAGHEKAGQKGEKAGQKGEQRPEMRPEMRPEQTGEQQPEARPEQRPEMQPEQQPEARPEQRPEMPQSPQMQQQPEQNPDIKLTPKS
jgi:iron-sulfur cluster repair protein YtfE (RIC family)